MQNGIDDYNARQSEDERKICDALKGAIETNLPDATGKVWHGSPVWFLEGNPIVGYNRQKDGVQLLFWSGASFEENLHPVGKFKAAEARYTDPDRIDFEDLTRWLGKSREIQWDYAGIVRRQGVLVRR